MALIKQYHAFKKRLAGYTEMPFDEFRTKIVALRQKKAWDEEDTMYVTTLVNSGAGHALQQFLGLKHPAGAKVLGATAVAPEPMTKADLDTHMRKMVQSCHNACWPAGRFIAFAAYLDSDKTPKDLVKEDREQRRKHEIEASLFRQAAEKKKGGGTVITDDDWDGGEAPDDDAFATMYRNAGPVFKRVVAEHLAFAAQAVPAAAPAVAPADEK